MRDLSGKVAVITGAGSGFGRALAIGLAKQGVIPVLLDKSEIGIAETIKLIGKQADIMWQAIDVRDSGALIDFAAAVQQKYGHIDIMINNAGMISRAENFLEMDEAHSRLVFDVNYWGVNNGCRAFAPYLAKQPEAALVNVASSLGVFTCPLHTSYCASKAAVVAYTEVLRQELSGSRVAITLVLPGAAKTNLGQNILIDDAVKKRQAAENFERFAKTSPDKVAAKIIHGIKTKSRRVSTGLDGVGLIWFAKYFPATANKIMNFAYRRTGDAEQFIKLDKIFS